MMSRARFFDVLSLAVLAASAVGTFLVYDRLPLVMATHFDIHGTPNGFMPRPWGAYFMPVFGLAIWAFVRAVGRFSPSGKKKVPANVLALVAFLTVTFLAVLHGIILHVALEPSASIMRPLWISLGLFIGVIGLILPRLRQNAVAGIRTAWTLGSPEVWAKTQRFASYTMATAGLVCIVAGLVGGTAAGVVAIAAIFTGSIVPAVYSFFLARSIGKNA
jgi:uncharacterized membrane protein